MYVSLGLIDHEAACPPRILDGAQKKRPCQSRAYQVNGHCRKWGKLQLPKRVKSGLGI